MNTPRLLRRLHPGWILLLAAVLLVVFGSLQWWVGRTAIRETRRLHGWTAVAPNRTAFEPFAVDGMIHQIGFGATTIPDEYVDLIVRNLSGLSAISLPQCRISNENLRKLREVSTLRDLNLKETDADDATAAVLAELVQLQHVALDGTRITDAALPELARLPKLSYLGLAHTAISDSGLAALRGHRALGSLDLSHTNVTDAGLEQLRGLGLVILILEGTRVTPEGVDRFREGFRGTIVGTPVKASHPGE